MKVALLVAQDVQDEEYIYPYYRFQEAGLELDVVLSLYKDNHKPTGKYGVPLKWNKLSTDAVYNKYDLIVIPGGWCPEILRLDNNIIELVKSHLLENKLIAAICHGPQVLISAKTPNINGADMTGYIGIKDDINNAGFNYINNSVVKDHHIITANHYNANAEFIKTILESLNEPV